MWATIIQNYVDEYERQEMLTEKFNQRKKFAIFKDWKNRICKFSRHQESVASLNESKFLESEMAALDNEYEEMMDEMVNEFRTVSSTHFWIYNFLTFFQFKSVPKYFEAWSLFTKQSKEEAGEKSTKVIRRNSKVIGVLNRGSKAITTGKTGGKRWM